MPCGDGQNIRTCDLDNIRLREEIEAALERLDTATQFLCYMIGERRISGDFHYLPESIQKWSTEHDEVDERRVRHRIRLMIEQGMDSPLLIANKLHEDAKKVHPVSRYHVDWFYQMAREELGFPPKMRHTNYD